MQKLVGLLLVKMVRLTLRSAIISCACTAVLVGCQSVPIDQSARDEAAKNNMVAAIVRRDIVLFGEVHDHPAQHALRADIVRRALAQGARPALAFEQFDRDVQARIDATLAKKPASADEFLGTLFPNNTRPKGWKWPLYAPLIELALTYELPIIAANLSRADAIKVSMRGVDAVFDSSTKKLLGLDRTVTANVRAEQSRAIQRGHCNELDGEGAAALLGAMANAQLARDAVLAERLRAHVRRGVILFAGNGHTRRDIGVGYWLASDQKLTSIGLLERSDAAIDTTPQFDIVVTTEPHPREDPCIAFHARRENQLAAPKP